LILIYRHRLNNLYLYKALFTYKTAVNKPQAILGRLKLDRVSLIVAALAIVKIGWAQFLLDKLLVTHDSAISAM
jgi:hypothetical protein